MLIQKFPGRPLTCRFRGYQGLPKMTQTRASLTVFPPAPPLLSPQLVDYHAAEATPVIATPVSLVLQPDRAWQDLHRVLARHLPTYPAVAEQGENTVQQKQAGVSVHQ